MTSWRASVDHQLPVEDLLGIWHGYDVTNPSELRLEEHSLNASEATDFQHRGVWYSVLPLYSGYAAQASHMKLIKFPYLMPI